MLRDSADFATDSATRRASPDLADSFTSIRNETVSLISTLSAEDCQIQAMPDVSPPKWHLAHTTWFFETFVLKAFVPGYAEYDPSFATLFNSYYEGVGPFHPRPERGNLSRPSLTRVLAYRQAVDGAVARLLAERPDARIAALVELGLNHEQQHQELLITDVKFNFFVNPLRPAYRNDDEPARAEEPSTYRAFPRGVRFVGAAGAAFHFDNEAPRHRVHLEPFAIASRPVTNAEYLAFMRDGGYERADLWLSDAWAEIRRSSWRAPLYWERQGDAWWTMTLAGMRPLRPADAVAHVSFYEAAAYARWAGARLPTEFEWEVAATRIGYGDVWEWTASSYAPYPGYRPPEGVLGEYNGKFMCNQMVLRGGSRYSPAGHVRPTYRNFFPPNARWQRAGIRLAKDGDA
jgi:ergothioneine biosynthesis protein EgtB